MCVLILFAILSLFFFLQLPLLFQRVIRHNSLLKPLPAPFEQLSPKTIERQEEALNQPREQFISLIGSINNMKSNGSQTRQ